MQVLTTFDIQDMTDRELRSFLKDNFESLIGSHIATCRDSFLSKTIRFITKRFSKYKTFIPSHIGSIISIGKELYLFNMRPPKSSIISLEEYLRTTDENFEIGIRDFKLDTQKFTTSILALNNTNYGYFSALQCALKGLSWIPNRKLHCSEIHPLFLKEQGYFRKVKCDDLTPVECHEKLISGDIY